MRRRLSRGSGLYAELLEQDAATRAHFLERGYDLSAAWPESVPVAGEPLVRKGWQLPDAARHVTGVGMNDDVRVWPDDRVELVRAIVRVDAAGIRHGNGWQSVGPDGDRSNIEIRGI